MGASDYVTVSNPYSFDLRVRGRVPTDLCGFLVVPTNRRNKDRRYFARWHDSQTDLVRLDLTPGRPGRVQANVLEVDPAATDLGERIGDGRFDPQAQLLSAGGTYITQPNHGANIAGDTLWATNLLFGAPLEVDITRWKPVRVLSYLDITPWTPRISGTSHFAWSFDHRYAYFHLSHLEPGGHGHPVRAVDLTLYELDVSTGTERSWRLVPPPEDDVPEVANFHSCFYFEEGGRPFVGMLRTGALLETIAPHDAHVDHTVAPASASAIWIVELDRSRPSLQARLLPGVMELDSLALSHLDVDRSRRDGFVLFANFKEADVGEETHGRNIYGEEPEAVAEHYSGMIVEALNYGLVIRYEWRQGVADLRTFRRPYDPGRTSLGHSWLPINIQLGPDGKRLFCSFSGFRPRLLPHHIAVAYPDRVVDHTTIRSVPPLLMRMDAETLKPDVQGGRGHLSYAEPMAMVVTGTAAQSYVCTFSPESGLRIYDADNLGKLLCHAESPQLMHWKDTHFRPDPAHLAFVPR
ncbi:MAG TPA: hypothetical protein VFC19_09060 [Candidatus Limnocylindrales bacterium]|nr:hypothetical protein [Candidatus Limnocylindrales bacterium]